MDSRDALMSVERERADDDGVVAVTAAVAKDASTLFQSEKFDECVEVLNQLLQKKEGDLKILHNVAIVEFLRDECSDPKKLMKVLINVKRKIEDLARASVEQTDTGAQAANKSSSLSKGTNMPTNCSGAVLADKTDTSLVALNIATILFHLHEYSKALSVLEPLFRNIEPIDKTTALHVCLLILDIAFLTQDASNFSDVVNYLEKAFGMCYMPNQTDGGSTLQQQMPNLVMKSSSIPNNSSTPDGLNSEGTTGGNASEDYLSRTLLDETMEYETLLSTLDISGQSIPRLSNVSSSNISRKAADQLLPTINLKLQLPLYKLQLLLLTRNLKAAKREIKQAMNIAREVDSSRVLLLKSQLEYARGNYSKAFKLLRAASNQSDTRSLIIMNNNVGCIYFQQGKPHTSTVFFHRALNKCSFLLKEKPRKLTTSSQDKSLLISYNCGVQYLACGRPVLAARFLLKASLVFYSRPLLWLRLAECCLLAMDKGFLKCSEKSTHNPPVKVHVIGQGKWRQLGLENGLLRNGTVMSETLDSNAMLKLSLPFARQCLHNALHLLSCSESKNVKSGLSMKFLEENELSDQETAKNNGKIRESGSSGVIIPNGDAKEQRNGAHANNNNNNINTVAWNTMSEYEDICKRENQKIKQAILTDLSFVELELGNPVKALSAALALLDIPECSKMHAFLGHVYAAEALCLMNRPNDAAEHLSTYIYGGKSPYSEEDCKQWQANNTLDTDDSSTMQTEKHDNIFLSPEEARLTLYINLASMYTTQGDFEQATRYVAQALAIAPNSQEAALMSVFLDLKLGKSQEALVKLKRWCRVRFLPHNCQFTSAS